MDTPKTIFESVFVGDCFGATSFVQDPDRAEASPQLAQPQPVKPVRTPNGSGQLVPSLYHQTDADVNRELQSDSSFSSET
jgi:hypothetical protein